MHRTRVLITIDTESTIGGHFTHPEKSPVPPERHIYCKINGKDHGIGLMMDILERHGLKGVFFVETEQRHYFGGEGMEEVVRYILGRGHDVQLHIHPNFRSFRKKPVQEQSDRMADYSLDEQTGIIAGAREYLEECGVKDVCAFRAGNLAVNLDTMRALRNNGIDFSSNVKLCYGNKYGEGFSGVENNSPFLVEDVVELPVTCIKEIIPFSKYRPLQINAVSSREMAKAIDFYSSCGMPVITIMGHSFDFVKRKDTQYMDYDVRKINIARFSRLCEYLAKNRDRLEVATLSELHESTSKKDIATSPCREVYTTSPVDSILRYFQQPGS